MKTTDNTVQLWVAARVEFGINHRVSKNEWYADYCAWCNERDRRHLMPTAATNKLLSLYGETHTIERAQIHKTWTFFGMRLKEGLSPLTYGSGESGQPEAEEPPVQGEVPPAKPSPASRKRAREVWAAQGRQEPCTGTGHGSFVDQSGGVQRDETLDRTPDGRLRLFARRISGFSHTYLQLMNMPEDPVLMLM